MASLNKQMQLPKCANGLNDFDLLCSLAPAWAPGLEVWAFLWSDFCLNGVYQITLL